MSIKGWPSSEKLTDVQSDFVTVQNIGSNKRAIDVANKAVFKVVSDAVEANSTTRIINATGHLARVGDLVRITSGALAGIEAPILSISTNTITLAMNLPSAPGAGITFDILRYVSPLLNSDGGMTITAMTGATLFKKDGADQTVIEDTATPANNVGLPVSLIDTTGLFDIRTTMTATNTKLDNLLTELQLKADLTETQPVSFTSYGIVDQIDSTPLLDVSSTNITASSGNPVQVVASLADSVTKITSVEDIGEFIGVYKGAALSEVLVGILPLGGGDLSVSIPAGTRISLRHMKNTAITSGFIALNFIK